LKRSFAQDNPYQENRNMRPVVDVVSEPSVCVAIDFGICMVPVPQLGWVPCECAEHVLMETISYD
jgi:hypothetical protein